MKKKLFLIAALAVAAAVAAWYVLRMDQGDGMAYLTEPVTIGNITRTVNATGEVGAVQLVSVGAQVGRADQKAACRPRAGREERRSDRRNRFRAAAQPA